MKVPRTMQVFSWKCRSSLSSVRSPESASQLIRKSNSEIAQRPAKAGVRLTASSQFAIRSPHPARPCPVSPTIRLPPPAGWEASPSMYVLPLLCVVALIHGFTDRKAMVRQSRLLGRRSRHRPRFRTGPMALCVLFLLK